MYTFITLALPTILLASLTGSTTPSRLETVLNEVAASEALVVEVATPVEKVAVVEPEVSCVGCNENEIETLEYLWEYGIKDKVALATIMGNIKQESRFTANICEGGARVSYTECKSGWYGLIQWTSIGRYKGLGNFCARFSCDPSSLEGQTRWMINEPIFQRVLPQFEGGGQTVSYYMKPAYYWLGWGIKGNREVYAWDYESKLTWV